MSASDAKRPPLPRRADESVPVVTTSPLLTVTFPWQIKPPQESRVVVVKGTFDLVPNGEAVLSSEQEVPSGDLFFDDNLEGSLRYPSDLAIFKPKADVMVVGHAVWAPQTPGQKTAVRPGVGYVELEFGSVRRSLAVFGDRRWEHMGSPAPFDRIPLRYERAYGGAFSDANPVGLGHKTGVVMPNLEDPRALLKSPKESTAPACLAPIASGWRQRRDKLGTYNARWAKTRWPFFAEDFNWAYFQAAPPEQQTDYLKGDETYVLGGMHPEHPILRGKMPNLRPRVFVQQIPEAGGDMIEVVLRNDTVWIDVDAMKLVLVWRGAFDTHDDESSEVAHLFVTTDEVIAKQSQQDIRQRAAAQLAVAQPGGVAPPAGGSVANDRVGGLHPSDVSLGTAPLPAPPAGLSREQVLSLMGAGGKLAERDLSGADLSGLNFSGSDLHGALLRGANLKGARFNGANLSQAVLIAVDASAASFEGANLAQTDFTEAMLVQTNFSKAVLQQTVFASSVADDARFDEATGDAANFNLASLRRAHFERSKLKALDLSGCRIDQAQFTKASVPEARFYNCRGEGVNFEGAELTNARCDRAALPGAIFTNTKAGGSQWPGADLSKGMFQGAHLEEANFKRAVIRGANLNKVHAQGAHFRKAILTDSTFLRANLMQANFEGANLTRADFRGSNLYEAETWKATIDQARFDAAFLHGTKLAT